MLTAEEARKHVRYDPETGLFWSIRLKRIAGFAVPRAGCMAVSVAGRVYKAHRLAHLLMTGVWPPQLMDHINGQWDDNRWCNLRPATWSENARNRRRSKRNSSGYKGVVKCGNNKKCWRAQIVIGGKIKSLGYFYSPAEAHATYVRAAQEHFGDFARTE